MPLISIAQTNQENSQLPTYTYKSIHKKWSHFLWPNHLYWTHETGHQMRVRLRKQNKFVHAFNRSPKPLYIVDGKIYRKNPFTNINSKNVKNIDVLRDEEAMKKYGKRAANGAIIITTRKGNI